jgi:hypothetical protein
MTTTAPARRMRRRSYPVAQTATVTFDPQQTTIEQLRRWVLDFG